ncbi:E3 ubiquitin-ligase BRE1-like 2 isoform A [Micractinium conductrix]|uniref:E3 ubiquitin protein ligase n=1 Tax=Micractinium conductrix TaxID=554055 RepID=A0A2P6VGS3_9CHLO|nr:E3 ubiquitin-ligase BRE1-like 2 isoform B [Micractinium conductrix]PSC73291.1 E3 ubiquitin-ligase BRE1-like 2 isoform A [Micractinium conductrix]|eukprot:PSC73290.1 E3 ubiquitin-ligase BRE1-like 2 isoform B [Micractinium conductrix]
MAAIPRLDLLVDKNAKLSAQCDAQRKQINALEKRLEEVQAQEAARQETLLCVNRLWEELNASIGFIQFRASGRMAEAQQENTEATDADLLRKANPFLAKLLATHMAGDKAAAEMAEDFAEDVSDVEAALRERMQATLSGAATALALVEEAAARGAPAGGAAGGGDAEMEDAAATTPGGARGGNSKDAQLAALNNLLKAENNRLRDQALLDATKIKQLQSGLADREDELLVAQRKINQLRTGGAAGAGAAGAANGGAASAAPAGSPGAAAGGDAAEAARLHTALQRKAEEVEEREAALMKAEREIRDLKETLGSERERMARMQQYDQERFHHLNVELQKMEERNRELGRSRDQLLVQLHDLRFQLEQAAHLRRQLPAADERIRELERQLAASRQQRADTEAALARERGQAGGRLTAAELQQMLGALQGELAALRGEKEKHKGLVAQLEAAKASAEQQRTAAEAALAEARVLRERCTRQQAAISQQKDKENLWKEREADLRLFVEVATQEVLPAAVAARELAEARAAEAKAREQLAGLQLQLQGASLQATAEAAQQRAAAAAAQLDAALEEAARLKAEAGGLQRQLALVQQQVADLQAEGESYMGEIESVGQAYEDAQAQNARLLASLTQRDEDASKMLQQATAASHERQQLAEDRAEAAAAAKRGQQAAAAAQQRGMELEARVQGLLHDLDKVQGEARAAQARAEAMDSEVQAREQLLLAARADAEATQAEAARRVAERDAEADRAQKEAARARHLEDQLLDAQQRLERLRQQASTPGAADNELQAECTALRAMINCNVCHQRQKDVIITKCWHMFCQHCIKRNLDSRHRKCPGCGVSFGQGDVHNIWL